MESRWKQPFRWGLLMAFDDEAPWELPGEFGRDEAPKASPTCLTVPVLHAQDVEVPDDFPEDEPLPEAEVEVVVVVSDTPSASQFECELACPTGRLNVGDADNARVVQVPAGRLRVGVTQEPPRFAERVTLHVSGG